MKKLRFDDVIYYNYSHDYFYLDNKYSDCLIIVIYVDLYDSSKIDIYFESDIDEVAHQCYCHTEYSHYLYDKKKGKIIGKIC